MLDYLRRIRRTRNEIIHMGINDTNAATAFEGLLQPVEADEVPVADGPSAPDIQERKDKVPKIDAVPFRPRQRPSIPLLLVLDDSQRTAESIWIRKSPFRIGRVDGDLTIPVDSQLSGQHAELFVKQSGEHWVWHLKDLGSTNGTFARVTRVVLNPNQVLLIGSQRFRFEISSQSSAVADPQSERTLQWRGQNSDLTTSALPRLVSMDPTCRVEISLAKAEFWLGRDPKQSTVVLDDPLVSPRHVWLHCDNKGQWHAEGCKSLNGLWAQIDEVALDRTAWFQCGEQRFLFRPSKSG